MTYTRIANDSPGGGTGGGAVNNHHGIPTISASIMSNFENNTNHSNNGTHLNTNNNNHNNNNNNNNGGSSSNTSSNYFLDKKVDDSIETFLNKSLIQIGPELLSGCLTLSFFERRASKQLFGLVSHEQKVIWEQWIIRVVVNNTPRPVNDDKASIMERQRIQDTAENMLRSVFMKLYDCACGANELGGSGGGSGSGYGSNNSGSGGSLGNNNASNHTSSGGGGGGGGLDHIPPSMYEFEIRCSKRADDRESGISRMNTLPPLLNLNGS